MHLNKRYIFLLLAAVGVAVFLGGSIWFVYLKNENKAAVYTGSESALQKQTDDEHFWHARIAQVGGIEAYKEFSSAMVKVPVQMQHAKAHVFGKLLYEVEGLTGFQACDMQFSMGCYHEFFAEAVAHDGSSILPQLGTICESLQTLADKSNCRHGIGHGIQSWLGYQVADLLRGLALCKVLPGVSEDGYGGCVSGIYMEYNLRTMIASSTAIRSVQNNNYFAPCDSVSNEDLPNCAFSLSGWWSTSQLVQTQISTNIVGVAASMGERCRSFNLSDDADNACLRGVANIIVAHSEEAITLNNKACDAAASNERQLMVCRSFLAMMYFIHHRSDAESACVGLNEVSSAYCRAFATDNADYARQIPHI